MFFKLDCCNLFLSSFRRVQMSIFFGGVVTCRRSNAALRDVVAIGSTIVLTLFFTVAPLTSRASSQGTHKLASDLVINFWPSGPPEARLGFSAAWLRFLNFHSDLSTVAQMACISFLLKCWFATIPLNKICSCSIREYWCHPGSLIPPPLPFSSPAAVHRLRAAPVVDAPLAMTILLFTGIQVLAAYQIENLHIHYELCPFLFEIKMRHNISVFSQRSPLSFHFQKNCF